MPKSSNLRNNLMRDMIAPQAVLENNPKAKLLPLDRLISNPFQVRQDFSSEDAIKALEELANDVGKRGVLQPLIVRPARNANGENRYQIVAGERRYRAAGLAGLKEVPVIIEDYSDDEAQLISLTENLQRRDLSFKEEVDFLSELNARRSQNGKGGDTDLAELIHKSRTYVAKRLKLAVHPDLVEQIATNQLSINDAYSQAVERDDPKDLKNSDISNKVFRGNDAKDNGKNAPEKAMTNRGFKAHLVPFIRLREAVVNLNQEVETLDSDERDSLKFEMEQLEAELQRLRKRLS